MKKLFFAIQGFFAYLFLALPAFAADSLDPCKTDANGISQAGGIVGTLCSLGGDKIASTIQNIIIFIVVLAVIIALLYLLYGGVKWIMSRGDKAQVEAAREHIIAAVVGLIVVFLAIFIVSIVLAAFGIPFRELKIPQINSNTISSPYAQCKRDCATKDTRFLIDQCETQKQCSTLSQ